MRNFKVADLLLRFCVVLQARDTCASHIGHFDMINYFALAENESKARLKFNLVEKMLQPCGPPPERKQED